MTEKKEWLNPKEVSKEFGFSTSTLVKLRINGNIIMIRIKLSLSEKVLHAAVNKALKYIRIYFRIKAMIYILNLILGYVF